MGVEFLKTDYDKASYLLSLLTARATGTVANNDEFEMLRIQLLSNQNLDPFLPKWLKHHHNLDSFWNFIKQKFSSYADRRTYLSGEFTPLLDLLESWSQKQSTRIPLLTPSLIDYSPNIRNKRKVFVVHGRDNEAKQEVSRFIEKLGLEAIILHEQASTGKTIIEKIEQFSSEADFALVIYTPCDQGRGMHESTLQPKYRARQNVVFEHGYFMAKLGRENVCALVKGDIEVPNDISGMVYVTLDALGAWKQNVAQELVACGYAISNTL